MKKNTIKTIMCLLIATAFIMPLIGNNVVSERLDTKNYYFNNYDIREKWETNWAYMVDGNTNNYASTVSDTAVELCNESNCSGTDYGDIILVEIRAFGYYTGDDRDIVLRPVFGGTLDGDNHIYNVSYQAGNASYSEWFDITDDTNSHTYWTWTNVADLDCDVATYGAGLPFTLYCSIVEIQVTYIPD